MNLRILCLTCYIETIYTSTLNQNKIVEHAVATSYDVIHNTFTVTCEKSETVSFASLKIKNIAASSA